MTSRSTSENAAAVALSRSLHASRPRPWFDHSCVPPLEVGRIEVVREVEVVGVDALIHAVQRIEVILLPHLGSLAPAVRSVIEDTTTLTSADGDGSV
jgi:hypothetical protein